MQTSPTQGQNVVTPSQDIALVFSEPIQLNQSTAEEIKLKNSMGEVIESFGHLSQGLTIDDDTLIIDPLHDLDQGGSYSLHIPDGLISDLHGNDYEAAAGSSVLSFSVQGASGSAWVDGDTLYADFQDDLEEGKSYTIEISSSLLRDTDGLPLDDNYSIGFTALSAGNRPPILIGDPKALADGTEDIAYALRVDDLLQGYVDPDGDPLLIDNLSISTGDISGQTNGNWLIHAPQNFNGNIEILYDVSDGSGGITAATRHVALTSVNDAPVSTDLELAPLEAGMESRLITSTELLANAIDVDGDTLSVSDLSVESGGGALVDNGDGTWTYTPAANDNTTADFSYIISDNGTTNGVADPLSAHVLATLDLSALGNDFIQVLNLHSVGETRTRDGHELLASLAYAVQDGNKQLTGISPSLFFDSSQVSIDLVGDPYQPSLLGYSITADTSDDDSNPDTDSILALSYTDFLGNFPGPFINLAHPCRTEHYADLLVYGHHPHPQRRGRHWLRSHGRLSCSRLRRCTKHCQPHSNSQHRRPQPLELYPSGRSFL